MADVPKIALAAAVLGGYVLGRTKKGRVAFGAATYLAGRRFGLEPQQLLTEVVKRLRELPQFADLNEQLSGEALFAGRTALSAVADRKLADLADSLHQRTERIGSKGKEEPQDEDEEPEDEYEEEEEEPERPSSTRGCGLMHADRAHASLASGVRWRCTSCPSAGPVGREQLRAPRSRLNLAVSVHVSCVGAPRAAVGRPGHRRRRRCPHRPRPVVRRPR